MLDKRLIEADASKLDELRDIMAHQENPEKLHDIAMDAVLIEHGAVAKLTDCVRSLTAGNKVLLVTGPTLIQDVHEQNIKEAVKENHIAPEYFYRESDHRKFHVRPKAKTAAEVAANPHGGTAKKYCYWFNSEYVTSIIEQQTKREGKGV